jgi:dolichol-phosphate mannosyltransferase
MARTGEQCEVVLVNDGSKDNSLAIMDAIAAQDARFRVINLSRNYGHQIAVTAGIDAARGDAVITMDADLQDPPEVVLDMIAKWREGYHIVLGRRATRAGETVFKRATASLFYRFIRFLSATDLPVDVGDFRLLDRCVVDALRMMPEQDRYLRGMISWVGFRTATVLFERDERAAGETKYPLRAMMRLALNGVLGFSDAPLRIALWCGTFVSLLALAIGLWVFVGWFFDQGLVEGWTSTMVVLAFLGGIQLMMIGIVGLYIGRIHNEVKRRPLYFINPEHSLVGRTGGVPQTASHQPVNSLSGGGAEGGSGASQSSSAGPLAE